MDRISALPDGILTSILVLLPIKAAARTSILSHRWRFLWLTVPSLDLGYSLGYNVITDDAFTGGTPFPPPDVNRWLAAATQILLSRSQFLHISPLYGCRISIPIPSPLSGPFDAFICFISGTSVADFYLHNADEESFYHVPRRLFFSRSILFLTFRGCVVSPPTFFSGLRALRSLNLFSVCISNDGLDHILDSCPCLEDLRLIDCYGPMSVIMPPSVRTFMGYNRPGLLVDLEHNDNLVFFGLNFWTIPGELDDAGMRMLYVLMGLGAIESLCLRFNSGFGQCLQAEAFMMPPSLPVNRLLVNLKKLDVEIPLADGNLIMILPYLLESSPNLQELRIKDDGSESREGANEEYWMNQKNMECLRNHVSTIQLVQLNLNNRCTVNFAKFLLGNAHKLRHMVISYHAVSMRPWTFEKELVSLQSPSPHAEVIIKPFDKSEL